MRTRPFVARKCGEKIRYDTYEGAWRKCRETWKRSNDRMVPYRCPLCNMFHIGHAKSEDDRSTAFVSMKKVAQVKRPCAPSTPKVKKLKQKVLKVVNKPVNGKTVDPWVYHDPRYPMHLQPRLPRGMREKEMMYRQFCVMDDDGWNIANRKDPTY